MTSQTITIKLDASQAIQQLDELTGKLQRLSTLCKPEAALATACCNNIETCSSPCQPRSERLKHQRDKLMEIIGRIEPFEVGNKAIYEVRRHELDRAKTYVKTIREGI